MKETEMPNEGRARAKTPETRSRQAFDLEERTAAFGESAIALAKSASMGPVTMPIVNQLVRATTSVGANYCEADNAGSKRDFRHKISLCQKEARESMHWMRMLAAACPELKDGARTLWQEAKELNLIFAAILRKRAAD